MRTIDINCDLGEGFGAYRAAPDEEIYPLISSANIACGFHAGDPRTMRASVALAVRHRVAVGAHPGTADLAGFGRRAMELSTEELENLILYQVGALEAFCRAAGTRIAHVKPHGWLYNAAAGDSRMAEAIARSVKSLNPSCRLYGLSGSELIRAARGLGLPYAEEAFIDRSYESDGALSSRSLPGSLITDPELAARQCLDLVLDGTVRARTGDEIHLAADTLCVHGDNPAALEILRQVRRALSEHDVTIRPLN
jgi:UPF0271 protein